MSHFFNPKASPILNAMSRSAPSLEGMAQGFDNVARFGETWAGVSSAARGSAKVSASVGFKTAELMSEGSKHATSLAWKGTKSVFNMIKTDPKVFRETFTAGNMAKGAAISSGMYGLMAFMSDDKNAATSDRMVNYAKHGIAAGVDVASDTALSLGAGALAMTGPIGATVGGAIMAYNMFAGFVGMDTGSLALNMMNSFDERYKQDKRGPSFDMTQNTSMALQRQIGNLHASGSNLGEMMHN